MVDRTTQDQVAVALTLVVAIFIVGSIVALVVLAFAGQQGGQAVWAGLFSLCTACLGAVGGYLGGKEVAARKNSTPPES